MRVGLTLHGGLLDEEGARFARRLGVEDVVVHLTDYGRNAEPSAYLAGGAGPINGDCIGAPLWSYARMAAIVEMLDRHGLRVAAMENISPNFWSDILLDGPNRAAQMDGLKRMVRDAGRAGIPVIGDSFSLAGVWGAAQAGGARRCRHRGLRGGRDQRAEPDPRRHGREHALPAAARRRPGRDRGRRHALDPARGVSARARSGGRGCRLAAHPDDPPVERLRGTARLVNSHAKYDRRLVLVRSPANALEFCIGSLAEMREGDIEATTRRFARAGAIAAANPDITVRLEITTSDGLPQRVLTALQSGAAPDIIDGQDGWVNDYAQNGLVMPLDDVLEDREDYVPAALDYVTWDGKLWALPYRIETHAVIYNRGDFTAAGLLPTAAIIVPLFVTLRVLGLVNTYWGLVLVYMMIILPLAVWMLTSYFKAIPAELDEAAIIDGASRLGVLFRITLPLSVPGIVAVCVYAFVTTWNEFIFARVFATDSSVKTLPIGLAEFSTEFNTDWGAVMAASVVMTLPIALLFLSMQRLFVGGMTAGATKG